MSSVTVHRSTSPTVIAAHVLTLSCGARLWANFAVLLGSIQQKCADFFETITVVRSGRHDELFLGV